MVQAINIDTYVPNQVFVQSTFRLVEKNLQDISNAPAFAAAMRVGVAGALNSILGGSPVTASDVAILRLTQGSVIILYGVKVSAVSPNATWCAMKMLTSVILSAHIKGHGLLQIGGGVPSVANGDCGKPCTLSVSTCQVLIAESQARAAAAASTSGKKSLWPMPGVLVIVGAVAVAVVLVVVALIFIRRSATSYKFKSNGVLPMNSIGSSGDPTFISDNTGTTTSAANKFNSFSNPLFGAD